jgi:hypothetical protein
MRLIFKRMLSISMYLVCLAHADHAINDLKRMLSMLLMILGACSAQHAIRIQNHEYQAQIYI